MIPWNFNPRTSGAHTITDTIPRSFMTRILSTLRFAGLPARTSLLAMPSPNPAGVNRLATPVRLSNNGVNTRSPMGASISWSRTSWIW